MKDTTPDGRMTPFLALLGDWTLQGTHSDLPNAEIHGRLRYEWLPGARFLLQSTWYDHPEMPDALGVIGAMEGYGDLSMRYFDSRGVHRVYGVWFDGRTLRTWRDGEDFAQRSTGTLGGDGATMDGVSERDDRKGAGFRPDLTLRYWRI